MSNEESISRDEAKEAFEQFIEEMSVPFDNMGVCAGRGIYKPGPAVWRQVISASGQQGSGPVALLECGHSKVCDVDCLRDNERNRKRALHGIPPNPCGWLLCDTTTRCLECEDLDDLSREALEE